ncbi:MAG TPA: hypothetical protein VFD92_26960 [Candidatus Binatia bacterium]|nr:hypothetical protein [Candidatus Binatia bacterium]
MGEYSVAMLSTATEAKLRQWVRTETWHTRHPLDMDRFYDFIDQYQRDHGSRIDEGALSGHIAYVAECVDNEELRAVIRERISLAYQLLLFLERTGR